MAIYQVDHIKNVDPAILLDLNLVGEWLVIRTSEATGKEKVWSAHKTAKLATAAKRRWVSREVVTR